MQGKEEMADMDLMDEAEITEIKTSALHHNPKQQKRPKKPEKIIRVIFPPGDTLPQILQQNMYFLGFIINSSWNGPTLGLFQISFLLLWFFYFFKPVQ